MTVSHSFAERVAALREEMIKEGLDAYLLPTSDAFQSEYLPPESRHMEWVCGFSGENGIVIVTLDKAATFVDGRFTVQITKQAPADIFEYCHINNRPPAKWLREHLDSDSKVGFDGYLHSAGWADKNRTLLNEDEISLIDCKDNLVNRIWSDRPVGHNEPAILLETAGQPSLEKRLKMAELLRERRCDALLISHPECTNWLLNIRGRDIPCTPVLMSYGLLRNDGTMELFIDTNKLTEGFYQHVGEGVNVHCLHEVETVLGQLEGMTLHIDPDETPARLFERGKASAVAIKEGKDPCLLAKSRKNHAELEGFRRSHIRDGIAMCQFLAWLDREVAAGHPHTEKTFADKIESLRGEQPFYIEPSFETISALGPNAAMCHYNHKYNEPRKTGLDGVYLLDSGGQYLDGTTDITRTIKVGDVTDSFKKMCTLVLKGHIGLADCVFPANTTGLQLDMSARLPLWKQGFDYDHGTGHGVGHCLGVHEFPGRFSNAHNSEPLESTMVMTIEPGYYRADEWGIRHENQYEVIPFENGDTEGDLKMLGFRHMTFVPFDTRLLDKAWLTEEEIHWVNDYHQQVYHNIAQSLNAQDRQWLKEACKAM